MGVTNNILRIVFMVFMAILTAPSIRAQTVSIDSVLSVVRRNNPMLQEYDERSLALNAYSEGSTSWMAPMVGAGTFMTPYPGQTLMDERDKGSMMFSVEQQIPNPAKLNATKKFLESKASVEQQGRHAKFNELRAEAKSYYYQWLVELRKKKTLEENKRIIELMLKLARIRYPYNQGSLGNIYKTEGRLNEVVNMISMSDAAAEETSLKLKALMNISPATPLMIDTTTAIRFNALDFPQDTAAIAENRSDVKQIEETIKVMELNQRVQKSQGKPDFKIRFDHMQPIGNMPKQFTAMAMVSIPIAPWSSKMYKSEVKGMSYDIAAMKKGRESILVEARGMLTAMAARLKNMQQQIDNYEQKIIPALRKNSETLMLAYEENREQLPLVIDGWEALNMAQLQYLDKVQEYYMMIVSYEKQVER